MNSGQQALSVAQRIFVPKEAWQARVVTHASRVNQWVSPFLERRSRHRKHPVYDFLFEYYSFRPGQLLRWSPGPGVILEASLSDIENGAGTWRETADGLELKPFPAARLTYLDWAIDYMERINERQPNFSCFGLHEWAMVYGESIVRHEAVPLRLSRESLDAFVESQQLCCTHFDAFRFFSEKAKPRNLLQLNRTVTGQIDQPACIHVNMDLYRFCYKIAPWIESELLADAFALAWSTREIDMRASPYDLSEFGFEPIPIETSDGRAQYVRLQREVASRAESVRQRVLNAYRLVRRSTRGAFDANVPPQSAGTIDPGHRPL